MFHHCVLKFWVYVYPGYQNYNCFTWAAFVSITPAMILWKGVLIFSVMTCSRLKWAIIVENGWFSSQFHLVFSLMACPNHIRYIHIFEQNMVISVEAISIRDKSMSGYDRFYNRNFAWPTKIPAITLRSRGFLPGYNSTTRRQQRTSLLSPYCGQFKSFDAIHIVIN